MTPEEIREFREELLDIVRLIDALSKTQRNVSGDAAMRDLARHRTAITEQVQEAGSMWNTVIKPGLDTVATNLGI